MIFMNIADVEGVSVAWNKLLKADTCMRSLKSFFNLMIAWKPEAQNKLKIKRCGYTYGMSYVHSINWALIDSVEEKKKNELERNNERKFGGKVLVYVYYTMWGYLVGVNHNRVHVLLLFFCRLERIFCPEIRVNVLQLGSVRLQQPTHALEEKVHLLFMENKESYISLSCNGGTCEYVGECFDIRIL